MNIGCKLFTDNVKKIVVMCTVLSCVFATSTTIHAEETTPTRSITHKESHNFNNRIENRIIRNIGPSVETISSATNEDSQPKEEVPSNDDEDVASYEVEVCSEEVVVDETYTYETYSESYSQFTYDERYLIAKVCMAEAEGESEYGKRLVISTILNRIDSGYYSNNVYDVVYQPYQFEVMMNGRIDRVEVDDYVLALVDEEIINRTNYDVIYFRTDYYSEYGTPLFQEGNHYFSGF